VAVAYVIYWVGNDFHKTFQTVAPEIFQDEIIFPGSVNAKTYGSRLITTNLEGYTSGGSGSGLENVRYYDSRHNISGVSRTSRLQQHVVLLGLLKAKYYRFMLLRRLTGLLSLTAVVIQTTRGILVLTSQRPFLPISLEYDLGDDTICWLQCLALGLLLWYAWTPIHSPIVCCGHEVRWKSLSSSEDGYDTEGDPNEEDSIEQSSSFFGSSLSFSSPQGVWATSSRNTSTASDA